MVDSRQMAELKASGASILAVDDERRLLDSLVACLKPFKLQVDTALGGKEACRKLLLREYDLVLLDLNMPDMPGHQVLDFAAENQLLTPFVVISGESSFGSVTRALKRGVADFLKKPYSMDELVATLSNALKKRFLERETSRLQLRLRQSEGLYRYIVNSSPDIIFMLDGRGCLTYINDKVESLLGYEKESVLGKPVIKYIEKEFRNKATYYFHKGAEESGAGASFELCLKRNGQVHLPRHFDITLLPVDRDRLAPDHINAAEGSVVYGTARDITEQKEAEEFISFQAYHDILTRLPNRVLFKDRLNLAMNQARRNNQCLAVMFLDLDRFKNVNDTLGHSIGDLLLEQVARRLEKLLRAGDTLSRFGGDEFTLLLPALGSALDAKQIAEKVIAALREPFAVEGLELFIGVSIGIALFPESGSTIEQLIKNADQAMYHVKDRGKDGYCFYAPSMTDDLSRQVNLERDLRIAIENNQFEIHYQPQIDIETGRIVGVEALTRWIHPRRGMICPTEFIGLAEETRLINFIGRHVMLTACTEVKRWIDMTGDRLQLAVNFSAVEMEGPTFAEDVAEILQETGFPAELFELELTEHCFISNADEVAGKISSLVESGVTVAVDDFGTGYSSLVYLDKLPIHTLKIDRSFIHKINDKESSACVVRAITAMAQGLRLNIIAEGIESLRQLEFVRDLGCHHVQGFYCGSPAPASVILETLQKQQGSQILSVPRLA